MYTKLKNIKCLLCLNPDSLWISPFGGAPSHESGFIPNNVPEDEYTKTELKDEILKPILKVLNYKIQNRSLVKQKVQ